MAFTNTGILGGLQTSAQSAQSGQSGTGTLNIAGGTTTSGITISGQNMMISGSTTPIARAPNYWVDDNLGYSDHSYSPEQIFLKIQKLVDLIESGDIPYVFKDGCMHPRVKRRMKTIRKMLHYADREI